MRQKRRLINAQRSIRRGGLRLGLSADTRDPRSRVSEKVFAPTGPASAGWKRPPASGGQMGFPARRKPYPPLPAAMAAGREKGIWAEVPPKSLSFAPPGQARRGRLSLRSPPSPFRTGMTPSSKSAPITNHQSPITNHQSPITNHQSPITKHQSPSSALRAPRSELRAPRSAPQPRQTLRMLCVPSQIVSAIGQVEAFVAQGEVGDFLVAQGVGQAAPVVERRVDNLVA